MLGLILISINMKYCSMKNILFLFISIILISCNGPKKGAKQEQDLTASLNAQWTLTFLTGTSLDGLSEGQIPYLVINNTEKTFSGKDGCNQISGTITILDNSKISFGPIMGTKMACMDMRIPNKFHTELVEVKSYARIDSDQMGGGDGSRSGKHLNFYNDQNKQIMSFTKSEK